MDLEQYSTLGSTNSVPSNFSDWGFHLRTLSNSAKDSNITNNHAFDPSLLHSVKKLCELCKVENSEDLVVKVYPLINKIFQQAVASFTQS